MTRPNTIFLGPDGFPHGDRRKVYIRGLLYSTSKKGQLIESMYVRLKRGETVRNFFVWVHGEAGALNRGSGLFVGQDGIVTNHHFLLAPDDTSFHFERGTYELEVICNIVGQHAPVTLFKTELEISDQQGTLLNEAGVGLHFDWGAESRKYYPSLDDRRNQAGPPLLQSLATNPEDTRAGTEK